MLSNSQIKQRELYKENQRLIKIIGEFKRAQNEMLLALNECALSEIRKDNKLKQSVINLRMKNAIKRYFNLYGEKYMCEEHIQELKEWKTVD